MIEYKLCDSSRLRNPSWKQDNRMGREAVVDGMAGYSTNGQAVWCKMEIGIIFGGLHICMYMNMLL